MGRRARLRRTLILPLILALILALPSCERAGLRDPTCFYASPYTATLTGTLCGMRLTLTAERDLGAIAVTAVQNELPLCFSSTLDATGAPGRVSLTALGASAPLPEQSARGIPLLIALLTRSRSDLLSLSRDTVSGQTVYLAVFACGSESMTLTLSEEGIPLRLSHPESETVLDFETFAPAGG